MNLAEPFAAICPTLDGPVLMVLVGTTRPLSAREVSRLARRGSWEGVRSALLRLVEHGIVTVQEVGNVTQYTLNRSHVAYSAVERLADLRKELFRRVSEAITAWSIPPVHANVFGSAARGDGDTSSDVDLFIVRPADVEEDDARWRDQLDGLARSVFQWTGNRAAISELSAGEVRAAHLSDAAREIRNQGVTVAGLRIEDLFEAGP